MTESIAANGGKPVSVRLHPFEVQGSMVYCTSMVLHSSRDGRLLGPCLSKCAICTGLMRLRALVLSSTRDAAKKAKLLGVVNGRTEWLKPRWRYFVFGSESSTSLSRREAVTELLEVDEDFFAAVVDAENEGRGMTFRVTCDKRGGLVAKGAPHMGSSDVASMDMKASVRIADGTKRRSLADVARRALSPIEALVRRVGKPAEGTTRWLAAQQRRLKKPIEMNVGDVDAWEQSFRAEAEADAFQTLSQEFELEWGYLGLGGEPEDAARASVEATIEAVQSTPQVPLSFQTYRGRDAASRYRLRIERGSSAPAIIYFDDLFALNLVYLAGDIDPAYTIELRAPPYRLTDRECSLLEGWIRDDYLADFAPEEFELVFKRRKEHGAVSVDVRFSRTGQ